MSYTVQTTVACAAGRAVIHLSPEDIYVCAGVASVRNDTTNALTLQASAELVNADGSAVDAPVCTTLSHTLPPSADPADVGPAATQCLLAVLGEATDGSIAWSANVLAQCSIRRAVALAAAAPLDATALLGDFT